jgi:hypothetical protein
MAAVEQMLRHMAEECDKAGEQAPVAAALVVLNANGQWAGMMVGVTAFAGTALLEHAKIDLVAGGDRWTEFEQHTH